MRVNTIKRHFRESVRSIGRNRWMTFASVSAVTVTLLLVGVFMVMMMNLNKIATNIEEDVEIKIIVDTAANDQAVKELENKLKKDTRIIDVQFSSKEQELEKMIESFGKELDLHKQSNPLGHVFYVKAANPQETALIANEVSTYDYAHDVKYGEGKVEKLFNILNKGRNVGIVFIIALLLTAAFLISNTIRITITARRNEIEIMKLVGATNNFVRIPFILEGIWLGVLGALLPMIIITLAYYNLYDMIQPQIAGELFQPLSKNPFIYQINGLLLGLGVVIGIWGSSMSVRKFLKV